MIELAPEEKIIKVVHKHWFVMLSYVFVLGFMAVAPIVIYVFLISGTFSILPSVLRETLVVHVHWGAFAYSLWIAFLWILFFIEWTDYYLDTWIVTNKRVVNIEQKGFFSREIITLRYAQIQDVSVEVKGLLATFLKFGLIQIETAGDNRQIVMRRTKDPELVKALIIAEQQKQ